MTDTKDKPGEPLEIVIPPNQTSETTYKVTDGTDFSTEIIISINPTGGEKPKAEITNWSVSEKLQILLDGTPIPPYIVAVVGHNIDVTSNEIEAKKENSRILSDHF